MSATGTDPGVLAGIDRLRRSLLRRRAGRVAASRRPQPRKDCAATNYLLTDIRAAGQTEARRDYNTAAEVLRKSARSAGPFDIFLSHSFYDAELVLGVRAILQRAGESVYVDWIDDPELDRSRVSMRTAARLDSRCGSR